MRIGLSSLYFVNRSFKTLIKGIRGLGVRCWEIVDEGNLRLDRKRAMNLLDLKSSLGLEYTVHAPFVDTNIASLNPTLRRAIIRYMEKSIFHAGLIESSIWVLHPGWSSGLDYFFPSRDWDTNVKSIRKFKEMAECFGIKVAVENFFEPLPHLLKSVEDFDRFFNEVGDVYLTLDLGHAHIMGQTFDFLTRFQDRILVIHVHDNDGSSDTHSPIGQGSINWEKFIEGLIHINYKNYLIIEAVQRVEESFEKLRALYSAYGTSTFIKS